MTLNHKVTAQVARSILPTCTKADIYMTGSMSQWSHFFNIRSIGTTGAPHPDMKVVADIALDIYKNSEPYKLCESTEN